MINKNTKTTITPTFHCANVDLIGFVSLYNERFETQHLYVNIIVVLTLRFR